MFGAPAASRGDVEMKYTDRRMALVTCKIKNVLASLDNKKTDFGIKKSDQLAITPCFTS